MRPRRDTVVDGNILGTFYAVKAAARPPDSINYLMSTEASVFSHSIRRVQVLPF